MSHMKNILYTILTFLLLYGCTERSDISKRESKPNIDTLYIDENTFVDSKSGVHNIEKSYSIKDYYLPKSKNITLNFVYHKSAKLIIDNSKVTLIPQSKDVKINSVKGNNKFNIFIKDTFKDSVLIFDFAITPKNNYVLSFVNANFITKYGEYLLISRHKKYVKPSY